MMTFRRAAASDARLLQQLAHEIWHLHYPAILSLQQIDYMLSQQYSQSAIVESMRKQSVWYILEVEGREIGFMACSPTDNESCKLDKIYIHPDEQGKGYGRNAVNIAIEFTKQQGASSLRLNVNRKNINSIAAYQRFGFKIIAETDEYIGEYLLDDYVMSLDIRANGNYSKETSLK